MFKKNSICRLIKNVKNLISSDSYKEKHCLEITAFTRNRKISFQDIIYSGFAAQVTSYRAGSVLS